MNNFTWGRKKNDSLTPEANISCIKVARFIMTVGIIICLAIASLLKDPSYTEASSEFINKTDYSEDVSSAEPFGYLNGEWNIWEYIGDYFASLITQP